MANNIPPVSNPDLIQAMKDMKATNEINEKIAFFREFVKSKLLLPVKIEPEPVNNVVKKDATVTFFSMKTSKNEILLACFTDFDQLAKWNKNNYCTQVIAFEFEKIKDIIQRGENAYHGIVIDPMGENVFIRKDAILDIESQTRPDLVVKPEKIVTENNMGLAPAAEKPVELINDLKAYMAERPEINAAYCMQTTRAGESEPTIVIVVDFKGNELKKTFDGIAKAAQNSIAGQKPIGMMPAFDKVAATAIKGVEPFYKK